MKTPYNNKEHDKIIKGIKECLSLRAELQEEMDKAHKFCGDRMATYKEKTEEVISKKAVVAERMSGLHSGVTSLIKAESIDEDIALEILFRVGNSIDWEQAKVSGGYCLEKGLDLLDGFLNPEDIGSRPQISSTFILLSALPAGDFVKSDHKAIAKRRKFNTLTPTGLLAAKLAAGIGYEQWLGSEKIKDHPKSNLLFGSTLGTTCIKEGSYSKYKCFNRFTREVNICHGKLTKQASKEEYIKFKADIKKVTDQRNLWSISKATLDTMKKKGMSIPNPEIIEKVEGRIIASMLGYWCGELVSCPHQIINPFTWSAYPITGGPVLVERKVSLRDLKDPYL